MPIDLITGKNSDANAPAPAASGDSNVDLLRPKTVATSQGQSIDQKGGPSWTNIGKSYATGLRDVPEGVAGFAGDIPDIAGGAVGWVANKLGADDPEGYARTVSDSVRSTIDPLAKIRSIATALGYEPPGPTRLFPTSQDVGAATDKAVSAVSPTLQDITRHQGTTTSEGEARTLGNFTAAAAAPVSSELSIPANIGLRVSRVAIPATSTELAAEGAKAIDPSLEPAARLVAGALSMGGIQSLENSFATRSALRKVNATPDAAARVQQILIDQGMTADDAAARMRELSGPSGAPAVFADTGSNARQAAQKVMTEGGAGRGIIDPLLRERETQTNPRLEADVTATVGPQQQQTDVLGKLDTAASALSPEYKAAHAGQTQPANTISVLDSLNNDLKVVKSPELLGKLNQIRNMLFVRGKFTENPVTGEKVPTLDTTSEGLHQARIAIDTMLRDQTGKPRDIGADTARRLNDYRAQIDQELADVGPIKDVDAKRAAIGDQERAYRTGQQIYNNEQNMPSSEEYRRGLFGHNGGPPMTPDEMSHVQSGANVETWRLLNSTGRDRAALQNLIAGQGKANFEKLAATFGADKAQGLLDALEREKTFQETYNKVIQGSKTAESQVPGQDRGIGGQIAGAVPEVLTGGLVGGPAGAKAVALSKAKDIFASLVRGKPTAGGEGMARMLMSQNPDDIVQAMQILKNRGSVLPAMGGGALLSRQQEDQNQ